MGLGGAKSGNSMIIVSGRIDDDLTKLVFVNIPDAKKKAMPQLYGSKCRTPPNRSNLQTFSPVLLIISPRMLSIF
jgi:hypothetical protein